MLRRNFIIETLGAGIAIQPVIKLLQQPVRPNGITNGPAFPIAIYNNWSAYDELSDNIPLTEELAMRQLGEMLRLQKSGVHWDYYMMDAFWFDKQGGYRQWHKEHWPNGPDKWLAACRQNNIKPGMWFSTNLIATKSGNFLDPVAEWKDSVATDPSLMCLFSGGYLKHLSETLQLWYDKGVRAFKFDFAYFNAATPEVSKTQLPQAIEEMNKLAFMNMLKQFRIKNADVLITGYNGFGGDMENTVTPFRKSVDPRWMEVFDTMYSGDPRFSDVPMMNIWRSQDNYSDHMVRQFEFNGLPIRRIDNCAFMIGKTGTCYSRALNAWKGMLILEFARGGWVNVFHGNLDLLSDADAKFFAKTQSLFMRLQKYGAWNFFGNIPGEGKPYGFMAEGINGAVLTMVNPSQAVVEMKMPVNNADRYSLIYADGGYEPSITGNMLKLGPEQLVVAGVNEYAKEQYKLGTDETVRIPISIEKADVQFSNSGKNSITATMKVTGRDQLRILFQQFDGNGKPFRSWGGAPPTGTKMSDILQVKVMQSEKQVPLSLQYDKMIWSGLSWGAAEIQAGDLTGGTGITITCHSADPADLKLKADVYIVKYHGR